MMRKRIQLNEIYPPAEGELGRSDLDGADRMEETALDEVALVSDKLNHSRASLSLPRSSSRERISE
jgi:hypothetical protein